MKLLIAVISFLYLAGSSVLAIALTWRHAPYWKVAVVAAGIFTILTIAHNAIFSRINKSITINLGELINLITIWVINAF
jgi:hypothetical protein